MDLHELEWVKTKHKICVAAGCTERCTTIGTNERTKRCARVGTNKRTERCANVDTNERNNIHPEGLSVVTTILYFWISYSSNSRIRRTNPSNSRVRTFAQFPPDCHASYNGGMDTIIR